MFKLSFDRFGSAVYVLYKNGEIYYIGKSVNVFARIGQHERTFGMDFDRIDIYPCNEWNLQDFERMLIELYQPPHNTQMTRVEVANMPFEERLAKLEKFYGSKVVGEKSIDNIVSWIMREDKKADVEFCEDSLRCNGCKHAELHDWHGLPYYSCGLKVDQYSYCQKHDTTLWEKAVQE